MEITAASLTLTGSLPAGTNNIGDVDVLTMPSIPAGTNNIGDVDVLTLPSLPAGSNSIGTVDTELPAAVALSDSLSNPTAPAVGAFGMLWDSQDTVWRRAAIADPSLDSQSPSAAGVAAVSLFLYDGQSPILRSWNNAVRDGNQEYRCAAVVPHCFNGADNAGADRIRSANSAANTSGTGVPACHSLAHDGTNYQTYRTVYGTHANAWNAAATGAGGTSTAVDVQFADVVSVFGNTSGASTITVQFSQNNSSYYDSGTTVAANGDFGISFAYGARYIRLKSSANVTATVTISAKV